MYPSEQPTIDFQRKNRYPRPKNRVLGVTTVDLRIGDT
jgi:hypothetical protein